MGDALVKAQVGAALNGKKVKLLNGEEGAGAEANYLTISLHLTF